MWQEVKRFLENPGEVLERIKEHAANEDEYGALEQRRGDLGKRLRQKQAEKDRHVKLYARGDIDDAELDAYLQDLNL